MAWLYGSLFGIVIGTSTGCLAELVRIPSLLQSVVSVFVALAVSTTVTMMFLWSRHRAAGDASGYFGIGADNLVYLGVLCMIGAILHIVLGRLGSLLPTLGQHRPIVLGAAAGLYGALSGVWAMTAF